LSIEYICADLYSSSKRHIVPLKDVAWPFPNRLFADAMVQVKTEFGYEEDLSKGGGWSGAQIRFVQAACPSSAMLIEVNGLLG